MLLDCERRISRDVEDAVKASRGGVRGDEQLDLVYRDARVACDMGPEAATAEPIRACRDDYLIPVHMVMSSPPTLPATSLSPYTPLQPRTPG